MIELLGNLKRMARKVQDTLEKIETTECWYKKHVQIQKGIIRR